MNLGEEIDHKMAIEPRWKDLPYEYAVICIALGLTYAQAQDGFDRHMQPEEIMFEVEDFSDEQIEEWYKL